MKEPTNPTIMEVESSVNATNSNENRTVTAAKKPFTLPTMQENADELFDNKS